MRWTFSKQQRQTEYTSKYFYIGFLCRNVCNAQKIFLKVKSSKTLMRSSKKTLFKVIPCCKKVKNFRIFRPTYITLALYTNLPWISKYNTITVSASHMIDKNHLRGCGRAVIEKKSKWICIIFILVFVTVWILFLLLSREYFFHVFLHLLPSSPFHIVSLH